MIIITTPNNSNTFFVKADGADYIQCPVAEAEGMAVLRYIPVAEDVVLNGKTIMAIACGRNNGGMCVDSNGIVYGWGDNSTRIIGDGTNTVRSKPVETTMP